MHSNGQQPVYSIGVTAELIGVHPRTLRIYEQERLIKPARRGGKRFYSNIDLQWLKCLRKLIVEEKLNLAGVKKLLKIAPCWSIRDCPDEKRKNCPAVLDIPLPCWEIKDRCGGKEELCSECQVYLKKMDYVMNLDCSERMLTDYTKR